MDFPPSSPVLPASASPETSRILPSARPEPVRPLVSDAIRHPNWLWATHVVPVGLILLSGQYTYSIISSEMSTDQKLLSLVQAVALAAILAGAAVMAVMRQRKGRLLSNGDCGALLGMSCVVMGIGVAFNWFTIPERLPEWEVGRAELFCRFFCLGMPGAFYALLLLTSAPLRHRTWVEFSKAFGFGVICISAFAFYCYSSRGSFFDFLPEKIAATFCFLFILLGGISFTAIVIRLTLITYTSARRAPSFVQQFLMFAIALAGPVGGLWLNRTIPFPTDFQAPIVYLLAVINGGVLMLPVVRSVFWHRAIWLAQCVMFPFSAYFFIVFLPWMPLSTFAMIAAGAGFLMLVPIVLGLAHGYRIVDGYREEIRDGSRWKPAVMGLAAVLVLPVALGWSMWQDRRTLDEALDYVYAPDYRKDITFPGDTARLQNSLQHLRDMKHGIFLPFLSPAYNAIVFHGLVLPDTKIEYLQHTFFGSDKASRAAGMLMRSNSLFVGESIADDFRETEQPPKGGVLQDVAVTTHQEQGFSVSRLSIEMSNPGSNNDQFVTTLHIPEGVYVSDFGLVMGKDLVPARIVEKKTAMWVYEQIVSYHCDPGLLIYKSRTELEMRVYPFIQGQTRRAELELIHPDGTPTQVTIGDKVVELNPNAPADKASLTTCTTPAGSVAIAEGKVLAGLGIQRTPYLDLLIDCSSGSGYSVQDLAQALHQARLAFPEAKLARVTAINYDARDIVADPVPVDQLDLASVQKQLLPMRGGLLQDRFLKRGLLLAHDRMQKGADDALLRPQFVVISSSEDSAMHEKDLENFVRLMPDARLIFTEKPSSVDGLRDMTNPGAIAQEQKADPVLLWQWGGHFEATPAGGRSVATFPGNVTGQPLVYDPATGKFIAPADGTAIAATSRYADGVQTWAAQDDAALNPSLLQNGASALIGLSKKTRILIPDSSFIAVESMAQWRAMEEKEKQKLANKQVFELEEPVSTPEPSTWMLLVGGLVLLGVSREFCRKHS